MTTVLINGIGGALGAAIARRLSEQPEVRVIGLGRATPPGPIGRAEWLTARLTGRQLTELLATERVAAVLHVDFLGADEPAHSREAAVQQNVIGSMELLGACAGAGVRRVVLRSHSWVYGASPTNPTFIGESRRTLRSDHSGIVRDFAEVEQFVDDFAPEHPDLAITTLRCAPLVGGWSPIVGYLTKPGPRMLFGFNPVIQLLQIEDAAAAFVAAVGAPGGGAFNLAADDTLCLAQAIRLAGQQPTAVLEPVVNLAALLGDRSLLSDWPYDISFLRHGCVVDTQRARTELGWAPAHGAAEALRALARANGHALAEPTSEQALRAFLTRTTGFQQAGADARPNLAGQGGELAPAQLAETVSKELPS